MVIFTASNFVRVLKTLIVVVLFISSFLSSLLQIDSVLIVFSFWFFRFQDTVADLRVKGEDSPCSPNTKNA